MAGPLVVVVAGISTAWLAFSTADSLVEDDYYKQGLAVNQQVHRDAEAAARGMSAELYLGDDGKMVRVLLKGASSASGPAGLVLHLAHPTRREFDQEVRLTLGADGFYAGRLASPVSGRWRVMLKDTGGEWRLVSDWNAARDVRLQLMPAGALASPAS